MSAASQFFDGLHGVIFPFAGASAPGGFLLCYGQAVSRTTYAALYAAIGTTWGAGDGSTTFNVPDLRGRTIAGKDNMGGSAASRLTSGGSGVDGATLGAVGGLETHTLTTAQLAIHSHGVTDPTHNHPNVASTTNGSSPGGGSQVTGNGTQTVGAAATGITIQNSGSGNAHNNTQPTAVLNWIIKT